MLLTIPIKSLDFQQDKYMILDLSVQNPIALALDLHDLKTMEAYVFERMNKMDAKAAVGGYGEERAFYAQSTIFQGEKEARSIHLGIDIWMPAGAPVYAPWDSVVHSFQDNNNFADYGPTIILSHQLDNWEFYTLYGHLNRESLTNLWEGKKIQKGEKFAEFGSAEVNGGWLPHLHFQILTDLRGKRGDFIGVAYPSEKAEYLQICPDPNYILNIEGL